MMKPKLFHVVAVAKNGVIGKEGKLPWHFSSDLKHFKQLTWGNTILMGRKTFQSLGKPLPGRENFVLTRSKGKGDSPLKGQVSFDSGQARGPAPTTEVHLFGSLDEALASVKTPNCYIIGGAEIFKQTIGQVDGIYLTHIEEEYEGDVTYPEIPAHFKEKERQKLQDHPRLEVIFYENTLAPSS